MNKRENDNYWKEEKKFLAKLKKAKKLKQLKTKKQNIQSRENKLVNLSYSELLKMPEWKAKRSIILKRDNHACLVCKSTKTLNVHHRLYVGNRPPWEYHNSCLATLCRKCHESIHKYLNTKIMEIQLTECLGTPIRHIKKQQKNI